MNWNLKHQRQHWHAYKKIHLKKKKKKHNFSLSLPYYLRFLILFSKKKRKKKKRTIESARKSHGFGSRWRIYLNRSPWTRRSEVRARLLQAPQELRPARTGKWHRPSTWCSTSVTLIFERTLSLNSLRYQNRKPFDFFFIVFFFFFFQSWLLYLIYCLLKIRSLCSFCVFGNVEVRVFDCFNRDFGFESLVEWKQIMGDWC